MRDYCDADQSQVIDLWIRCDLTRPQNNPQRDILRKQQHGSPFWVLERDSTIVASIMVGYDGHRGSVNYLAVDPEYQGQGIARDLMQAACDYLHTQGCPKLNLMVRSGNPAEVFYQALGYDQDAVSVYSQRLIHDQ